VITNKKENRQYTHEGGAFEMGRGPRRELPRYMIDDPFVSGDQLRIEPLPGARVRIENLSKRIVITLADGSIIPIGESREVAMPARLSVGETLVELSTSVDEPMSGLSLQTITSPARRSKLPEKLASLVGLKDAPTPEKLTEWFETLVSVQRAAAGSAEFYDETARAIVDVVGLDQGLVLLRKGDSWQIAGRYPKESRGGPEFSELILSYVIKEKRTYFQTLGSSMMAASLVDVSAVVASPIFGTDETTIVGVVYGSRYKMTAGRPVEIRPLEAQVMQVLAAAVASGLARLESEAQAARRRVLFEQFFSPELAQQLDRNPTLLEGHEREVTVMFADIRGFSRISERIGPRETIRLAGEVMECLSARIREFNGVVVDYVGDGLLAMWNAPDDDPDHPKLACRAAIKMLEELPAIDERWQSITNAKIQLGIGINTGSAMVGNTGSQHRVKYGPLGHTVNLGSRVEGATKQLGVPILLTGSTFSRLDDQFATRRLGRFHVVGIGGEVALHELVSDVVTPDWQAKRQAYESALGLFEAGLFQEVPAALYPVLAGQAGRYDVPSLALLGRAIDCIKSPPGEFDPVLELDRK
jgi:adenylate cyclase